MRYHDPWHSCRTLFGPVVLALLSVVLGPAAAAQQDSAGAAGKTGFRVLVHADNPVDEMEADDVAKLFLKKVKRWDHDAVVTPIDLVDKQASRKAFTKAVHGKSVGAIESYWQRMIFSGRGKPPEKKATDEDVLRYVRMNPGAIGYVSDATPLGEGVKELKVTQ